MTTAIAPILNKIVLLPTADIVVHREERQRQSLEGKTRTHIESLAANIAKDGLINPILVEEETKTIVAGECRLEAFRHLQSSGAECAFKSYKNWTMIPCRLAPASLSSQDLARLEFAENFHRLDIPWQEEVVAVLRWHEAQQILNPEWTNKATAETLGYHARSISTILKVAREVLRGDKQIIECASINSARGILERRISKAVINQGVKAASAIHATLDDMMGQQKATAKPSEPPACPNALEEPKPSAQHSPFTIRQADMLEWLPQYSGPRFSIIHCDFPYGISWNKGRGFNTTPDLRDDEALYDDSPETYFKLLEALIDHHDRIMLPQSHIWFWFSMTHYEETVRRFEDAGFWVDRFPYVWHKSNNDMCPNPKRAGKRTYETALLVARGGANIVRPVLNLYRAPGTKTIHASEKPVSVLRHFFRMLVEPSATILDMTCGSGNAIVAAMLEGAESGLGLELNPKFAEDAKLNLSREVLKLKAQTAEGSDQ